MEDEIIIGKNTYRIKKMNAIQTLAMQSQISFDNAKETEALYYQILEKIEVKFNDNWLPVKEENKDVYYPADIENNLDVIQKLIGFFMNWFKEVFQKSNESNSTTE